ncbi:unnamed protein product [Prorocentrum cordatum]|uniref:PBP domain-containing protein n=1 Tax=Prorocentrum cordatum TaxID=2364126 RepID=A0ABN9Q5Q2_9DINO|nr:unnamed protein product [Polarella glacialis]
MSRDWHSDEASVVMRSPSGPAVYKCTGEAGITVGQLPIAWDGIAVFMRAGGAVEHCLRHVGTPVSMEQIMWMFTGSDGHGGPCKTWRDLAGNDGSHKCADACIERWVPGNKSGTLHVFEKAFNRTLDTSNQELYNASEDDYEIIQGVLASEHAIGFVGYNYYQNSSGLLSLVPLVTQIEQAFCMLTAEGRYPFSRQLFMNVNLAASAMAWELLDFGLGDRGQHLVGDAGACRLSDRVVREAKRYVTSQFHPAEVDVQEVEDTFEVYSFFVTGLLVVGCLFGLCLAKIISLERVRRRMPLFFRKAEALRPLLGDHRPEKAMKDVVIGRACDDSHVEDSRADPNMQLASMLDACGPEIGSYLSWRDVPHLWAAACGLGEKFERQTSVNSEDLLNSLLDEVWSAMDSESPAGRALQFWFMRAPSLQWCLTLSGEAVVSLLWALGALARPAVVGWHSELAALLLQRRAGFWVNQQLVRTPDDSLGRFVVGGRLPELATYVQWAYGGRHLDLRAADLIPLLMDLDPSTTAHLPVPPMPAQALRCAKGLAGMVTIDGQYYCFPHSAWERSGRSDTRPFSELAAAAGPLSEEPLKPTAERPRRHGLQHVRPELRLRPASPGPSEESAPARSRAAAGGGAAPAGEGRVRRAPTTPVEARAAAAAAAAAA